MILDFNKGKYQKLWRLSDIDMTDDEKKCLIGFHAFMGSDYTSAFFRKSKAICWKVLRNNSKFLQTFVTLGDQWMPSESLMNSLEEFVCYLFGSRRLKKINLLRFHLFQKSYKQKEEITDLALLPPCQETLRLHCLRSCYVAKIWKSADICSLEVPPVQNHGWDENADILWTEKSFPDDLEMILCDVNEEDYYSCEDDSESSGKSECDESDSDD